MFRATWAYKFGLIGAVILAVAVGSGSVLWGGPAKGEPEAGKQIYLESCQHCHGAQGDGKSEMAQYLTPPPADLTGTKTQSKKDGQLRKVITEGGARYGHERLWRGVR